MATIPERDYGNAAIKRLCGELSSHRHEVREAVAGDARRIAELLEELGYPQTPEFVASKILDLSGSPSDLLLVAESEGDVIAMAHLHTAPLAHGQGCLGRVMALVVTTQWRRQGVGGEMMRVLEECARRSGCTMMEITSGSDRAGAHRFYEEMGYRTKPSRFVKRLQSTACPGAGRQGVTRGNVW